LFFLNDCKRGNLNFLAKCLDCLSSFWGAYDEVDVLTRNIITDHKGEIIMAFNLANCVLCGDCLENCKYTAYDNQTGAEQIQQLIDGESTDILTECVTCAACNVYCEQGANPFDLILLRQEQYDAFKTTPTYLQLVESIEKQPSEIVRGKPRKPAINTCVVDVLPNLFEGALFEGCSFLRGGAYESMLAWIHVGKERPLRNGLQAKIDALAETGYDEIVMFHDDCYAAYTTKALEYGMNVPFKVTHYVEYLRDYLKAHPEKVQPLNMKIAYQQPCSSRYSPWMDTIMDELFSLMGVERVQRAYDRKHALCCGCPISPHLGNEKGEEVKSKNIKDAKEHDASAMVFMCPYCALQLREEVDQAGLEPIFLTNLVRRAIGEKVTGQPAGLGDDRELIVGAVQIVKGLL
jgi:Fe-S oxidoreductase